MNLYVDPNLRKFVASPIDGKTIVSLSFIAGNVVPILLTFVDTTSGSTINFGNHTLKVGFGGYQAPLVPVFTIVGNNLPWKFNLSLKTSGIASAINGLPSITATLQIFTTDPHGYKTTWAQQSVNIINPVLPWVANSSSSSSSSSSSTKASVSSSSSTAVSVSTSSSTAASLSSSSSTAVSKSTSSSSIHGHTFTGASFGTSSYIGTYTFGGTFNARDYWVVTSFGTPFYLYWNTLASGYTLNSSLSNTNSVAYVHTGSPTTSPTGNYIVVGGGSPGGTIS